MTDQLRRAIDASGMSRYAICKAIGLPQSTMSRFMGGECGLALETVDRLGALLRLRIVAATDGGTTNDRRAARTRRRPLSKKGGAA